MNASKNVVIPTASVIAIFGAFTLAKVTTDKPATAKVVAKHRVQVVRPTQVSKRQGMHPKQVSKRQAAVPSKFRQVRTFANYVKYPNVDALDNAADIVLVGIPLQDFLGRQHVTTRFADGTVQDFYTLTDVKVEKVIKKPSDLALEDSQTFRVIEPVGLIEEKNGKVKILDEDYQELKQGKKYILFLKSNGAGGYSIINMNLGKFNLDGLDPDDIGDAKHPTEVEEKVKFKKNVLSKFDKFVK